MIEILALSVVMMSFEKLLVPVFIERLIKLLLN